MNVGGSLSGDVPRNQYQGDVGCRNSSGAAREAKSCSRKPTAASTAAVASAHVRRPVAAPTAKATET